MNTSSPGGRILCFGEMLLRLSPNNHELLMQSPALTIRPAGAEANVAVSLARFGAPTGMATVLPDNALGHGARDEVRKHGVDTTSVVFRPGRMGLYFLTPGAVRRPSEVLYDRAGSAFVDHVDKAFDWDALLDGVEWLHASGVTPATGPNGTAAAVAIIEAAVRKGVKVSYDGNFRGALWKQWDGDPPTTLSRMLSGATVAFADDRDFALVLKTRFDSADPAERRRAAAKAAFAAFPRLQRIACTLRVQDSVADQALSAVMLTRGAEGVIETDAPAIHMAGVVDRVGGGDAFASGVIYALLQGKGAQAAVDYGAAHGALAMTTPGDASMVDVREIEAAIDAKGASVIR